MLKEIDGMGMIQKNINHKFKNMKFLRKKENKQELKKLKHLKMEIQMMNLKIMEQVNIKLK